MSSVHFDPNSRGVQVQGVIAVDNAVADYPRFSDESGQSESGRAVKRGVEPSGRSGVEQHGVGVRR